MRGAVCFALALYMDVDKEKKSVILTTTLCIILFTTLLLGGSALPFISFINKCYPNETRIRRRRRNTRRQKGTVLLSKTQEMVSFLLQRLAGSYFSNFEYRCFRFGARALEKLRRNRAPFKLSTKVSISLFLFTYFYFFFSYFCSI